MQVLDALSRALRLDADQEMHLYRLAGLVPSIHGSGAPESVGSALLQLMDTFDSTPAFVLNRTLDIVACNPLAVALFSPFTSADNLVRMVFTDPVGRSFYSDWRRAAQATVATLRLAIGHDSNDARLVRLVDEVSAVSSEFRELWDEGEARGKTVDAKKLVHPDVGPLVLTFHTFDVREHPGLQMVIYQAERGSSSDEALRLLGSLTATRDRERENANPEPLR